MGNQLGRAKFNLEMFLRPCSFCSEVAMVVALYLVLPNKISPEVVSTEAGSGLTVRLLFVEL